MPAPYSGQQWQHGWVPVSDSAATSKNHGRKPAAGSLLARLTKEAAESLERKKDEETKQKAAKKAKKTKRHHRKKDEKDQDTSRQVDRAIRIVSGRGFLDQPHSPTTSSR